MYALNSGLHVLHFFLFKNIFYILEQLVFIVRLSEKCEELSYTLCLLIAQIPHYHHPHQRGGFVVIDELTLTHLHNLESIVYIRIHSWCCTFCEFHEQMNHDWWKEIELSLGFNLVLEGKKLIWGLWF